ncbi:MAG: glycosyltransferase [Candidatus Nanosynbacter sp.]|nr:glycosyltransferase [Candidatus Nanosynbacter sp.]
MKLLAVGGGSGGHVTPVVAVINEIAALQPDVQVTFVCDKAFASQSRGLMQHAAVPVQVRTIAAGKFRRYQHLSVVRQLLMPSIVLANILDIFKTLAGVCQSLWLVLRVRPDVIFAKGGFVCLPVGIAARCLRVPVVIHDSDARPGLTNRVMARWAAAIATGWPLKHYHYPASRSRYVGVPIGADFRPLTAAQRQQARQTFSLDPHKPLVVATGGGLGSAIINHAVLRAADNLLAAGMQVYLVAGKGNYDAAQTKAPQHPDFHCVPFVFEHMAQLLGAADVVVSRASATFTQELAGLAQAAILVPAHHLGDQRKNAAIYAEAKAALVLQDDALEQSDALSQAILTLVRDPAQRQQLAQRLHTYARPHAARDVAQMVVKVAQRTRKG